MSLVLFIHLKKFNLVISIYVAVVFNNVPQPSINYYNAMILLFYEIILNNFILSVKTPFNTLRS